MPELFRVVCTIKALYKCSDLPFVPLMKPDSAAAIAKVKTDTLKYPLVPDIGICLTMFVDFVGAQCRKCYWSTERVWARDGKGDKTESSWSSTDQGSRPRTWRHRRRLWWDKYRFLGCIGAETRSPIFYGERMAAMNVQFKSNLFIMHLIIVRKSRVIRVFLAKFMNLLRIVSDGSSLVVGFQVTFKD